MFVVLVFDKYLLFLFFVIFGTSQQTCFALFFQAVAFPFDVQRGGMMQQAIKDSGGQDAVCPGFLDRHGQPVGEERTAVRAQPT